MRQPQPHAIQSPDLPQGGRRSLLKALAAAPLLPLGGGAAALLSACATPGTGKAFAAARFTGMAAPTLADPAAMASTTVGSALEVSFTDGTRQTYQLAYQPFFMTGDMVPDGHGGTLLAGGYVDIKGQPIIDRSLPGRERQFFSDCPDGSSLLSIRDAKVPGVKGNTVFAVVQFEYTTRDQKQAAMYGQLPSPIAVLTLDQEPNSGKLSLVKYHNVDTSQVHGLWITCGASLSPWNTHLSSEEYEPDASAIAGNPQFKAFSRNLYGDENRANPYHYGHLPEVTVNPDGTGSIKKHYCLGRISHELVQVMPDQRTVLMGDDATNGGLFMFVADRAADLSSGSLYVARWQQTSDIGPGAGRLDWIKLGSASSDEVRAMAERYRASDIMDIRTTDPGDGSFSKIPFNGKFNWVRVKPGMQKAAAFLETHRYAALAGGSLGFTKMEGTTVNTRDKIAYSAMSYIQTSMLDGSGHIKVQGPKSGAVYALNLRGGQRDVSGEAMASQWVPIDMAPPAELVGVDLKTPDALGNLAAQDRIANPDNIKFSEKLRTLFIGEDSGMHVNNFLWAYHVDTRTLTRILSCPAGAESTGLHAVDEINGWTYVMSNFQHAGDWEKGLHDKVRDRLDPLVRANYKDRFGATVGYLTGVALG
ncbi:PhoX family phosphatase [Herbaspirillum sp. YR522]|uniref:PhoX family protein n=1 Tax=Herbaspirillum sp. YR522 TaxID=1144342 RepID=UPI00026F769E|nr:alkaline phosphatase PhoX [Herbaspirillum sp. YR522]EJN07006.1 putative phosphatase [Herbaspirillum sp. YR522]